MPYRQPAERTPEQPAPTPVVATHEAEPARDDPSTMWVSDSDAREREERERRSRLAKRMLYAALVVVITGVFVVLSR